MLAIHLLAASFVGPEQAPIMASDRHAKVASHATVAIASPVTSYRLRRPGILRTPGVSRATRLSMEDTAAQPKVAYVFATSMSSTFKLGQMILPQLENGTHGAQVAGMFFFDDNGVCFLC